MHHGKRNMCTILSGKRAPWSRNQCTMACGMPAPPARRTQPGWDHLAAFREWSGKVVPFQALWIHPRWRGVHCVCCHRGGRHPRTPLSLHDNHSWWFCVWMTVNHKLHGHKGHGAYSLFGCFLIVDTQNDILLLCGLVRPHRLILHRHLVKQHVKKQRKVDRPNERGHKSRSLFRRTGLHSALIAWLLPAFWRLRRVLYIRSMMFTS